MSFKRTHGWNAAWLLVAALAGAGLVTACKSDGSESKPRTAAAPGARPADSTTAAPMAAPPRKTTETARPAERARPAPRSSMNKPVSPGKIWVDRAQAIEMQACACQLRDRACAKVGQQLINDYLKDTRGVSVPKADANLVARSILKAQTCVSKVMVNTAP